MACSGDDSPWLTSEQTSEQTSGEARAALRFDACPLHGLEPPGDPSVLGFPCRLCAATLAPGVAEGGVCGRCRRAPPPYRSTLAAFSYGEERVRAWTLAFKHGRRPDLAAPMAMGSWESFLSRGSLPGAAGLPGPEDWLVPVPLHPSRLVERGYDQAALYARELARLGAGRVIPLLRRRRSTAPQGAASAPSRRANVQGAFRARAPVPEALRRTVWIVDDVMTSGATAGASALALRRAGLRDIRVLCFARA